MTGGAALSGRRGVLAEALGVWAVSFTLIVTATLAAPGWAKATAVVTFLYFPAWAMWREGANLDAYGLHLRAWRTDLLLALGIFAVVLPLYALGWFLQARWSVPSGPGAPPPGLVFHLRAPEQFSAWIVDEFVVTALPEEFFYRGWLQARLERVWPTGTEPRVLGVPVGRAFVVTAALFALGHLAIFRADRLLVFFPALLFGWLRGRTGTVVGSTVLHALCNLAQLVLGASFSRAWDVR